MSQGCISSDGKLSERALELIRLFLEKDKLTDLEISQKLKRPLFQVRSSLRELCLAGILEKVEEFYRITEKGKSYL